MEELVSCNPVACVAGEEISNIFFSENESKSREELSGVAVFKETVVLNCAAAFSKFPAETQ